MLSSILGFISGDLGSKISFGLIVVLFLSLIGLFSWHMYKVTSLESSLSAEKYLHEKTKNDLMDKINFLEKNIERYKANEIQYKQALDEQDKTISDLEMKNTMLSTSFEEMQKNYTALLKDLNDLQWVLRKRECINLEGVKNEGGVDKETSANWIDWYNGDVMQSETKSRTHAIPATEENVQLQ